MLNVNPETVVSELEGSKAILEKWIKTFNEGLPVIDQPGSEQQLELLVREFCGELRVVAGKCGNLSEVVLGE